MNIKLCEIDGQYAFELSGGQMQRMLLPRAGMSSRQSAGGGGAHGTVSSNATAKFG